MSHERASGSLLAEDNSAYLLPTSSDVGPSSEGGPSASNLPWASGSAQGWAREHALPLQPLSHHQRAQLARRPAEENAASCQFARAVAGPDQSAGDEGSNFLDASGVPLTKQLSTSTAGRPLHAPRTGAVQSPSCVAVSAAPVPVGREAEQEETAVDVVQACLSRLTTGRGLPDLGIAHRAAEDLCGAVIAGRAPLVCVATGLASALLDAVSSSAWPLSAPSQQPSMDMPAAGGSSMLELLPGAWQWLAPCAVQSRRVTSLLLCAREVEARLADGGLLAVLRPHLQALALQAGGAGQPGSEAEACVMAAATAAICRMQGSLMVGGQGCWAVCPCLLQCDALLSKLDGLADRYMHDEQRS